VAQQTTDKQAPPPINSPEAIERGLGSNTVAIVGLSSDPDSHSYHVGEYLLKHGYKVIPVNPKEDTVLGQKSYPSLKDIPDQVDVVDVFRRPDAVQPIAEDAVAIGAKVLWMQLGIANPRAGMWARGEGLTVVMNRCMRLEHIARHGGDEDEATSIE